MSKTQKRLTVVLWALVVVVLGAMAASAWKGKKPGGPERMFEVPEFALIDQNGKAFSKKDLMGKVWVGDFVFTRCAGPCPLMTQKMAELQGKVGPEVKLVSFSVDPEYDRPSVLKEYGRQYGADEARWTMATGELSTIYDLAAGMKIAAKPAEGETPIIHSTKFVLVDEEGWIRGYYDGRDDAEVAKLAEEAARLVGK